MDIKHKSPFLYGTAVSSGAFTNREHETKKLIDNLTGSINTIIISPRRWGKTSLVGKVAELIEADFPKSRVVQIDLFNVANEREFYESLVKAVVKSTSNRWEEWIKLAQASFKRIIPRIQLSADPTQDFSLSFDVTDFQKDIDEILDFPEKVAKERGLNLIICIDEFQQLATYPGFEQTEKKLRSHWQKHQHVNYCLYGSKRHMMSELFNKPSKPFYRFGDVLFLERIKEESWVKFITEKFEETEKSILESQALSIAKNMKNHPWYVQQLAHYTWIRTDDTVNESILNDALKEVLYANSPFFQQQIESLSATQRNLVKALLYGETKITSTSAMTKYDLGTPRNVSKNRNILIELDIIDQPSNGFEFLDPVFELWLRENWLK